MLQGSRESAAYIVQKEQMRDGMDICGKNVTEQTGRLISFNTIRSSMNDQ